VLHLGLRHATFLPVMLYAMQCDASKLFSLTAYAAGPVFGNRDYFSGLAIYLDTYPNVGGEHGVSLLDLLLAFWC